jgi:hypothetical protein
MKGKMMNQKIKEIVDQFLKDKSEYKSSYKYRINHSYYVRFQPTLTENLVRVYLGVELPGYEYCTCSVYQYQNGILNDDDKGLAALIEMKYKEAEKMNQDNVSVGYNMYKSVLADNDELRKEITSLEKEVEYWKNASTKNHEAYILANKRYEQYHDKYIEEKLEHTTTASRMIFAKHILNGNRDEKVKEYMNRDLKY